MYLLRQARKINGLLGKGLLTEVFLMIDFNEEIARFQPSLEVDQAEEAIYNNDMTDLADIIDLVLKGGSESPKNEHEGKYR